MKYGYRNRYTQRTRIPDYPYQTSMSELNIVDQLLNAGFKETWIKDYNPKNNWFGVSKYHPDALFVRDNKEVIISLGGAFGTIYVPDKILRANIALFNNTAARIIILFENKKITYLNIHGVFPPTKILNEFLV